MIGNANLLMKQDTVSTNNKIKMKKEIKMKKRITVLLNDFNKIKKFCNEVSKFASEIDIHKGRYVVCAKSIMGLYSLDLSEPIDVVIHTGMIDEIVRFNEIMEEFK